MLSINGRPCFQVEKTFLSAFYMVIWRPKNLFGIEAVANSGASTVRINFSAFASFPAHVLLCLEVHLEWRKFNVVEAKFFFQSFVHFRQGFKWLLLFAIKNWHVKDEKLFLIYFWKTIIVEVSKFGRPNDFLMKKTETNFSWNESKRIDCLHWPW